MFGIPFTEVIGYLAMLTLLVSFLMKDVVKLRLINTLGCFVFVVYGFLLDISWPIVITNVSIMSINIYYLIQFRRKRIE